LQIHTFIFYETQSGQISEGTLEGEAGVGKVREKKKQRTTVAAGYVN